MSAATLEKGIQDYLSGNYARPLGKVWRKDGIHSKHDQCVHGRWMYEECEICIDDHFEGVLTEHKKEQSGGS